MNFTRPATAKQISVIVNKLAYNFRPSEYKPREWWDRFKGSCEARLTFGTASEILAITGANVLSHFLDKEDTEKVRNLLTKDKII